MTKPVPCPRCGNLTYRQLWKQTGCLLCDDNRSVSPALAAAYRLLCIDGLPGRFPIEQIRKDLGE